MAMGHKEGGTEAQRYVWRGAIPLQIHLHDSEVTTLPPPPPALVTPLCIKSMNLACLLIYHWFIVVFNFFL